MSLRLRLRCRLRRRLRLAGVNRRPQSAAPSLTAAQVRRHPSLK